MAASGRVSVQTPEDSFLSWGGGSGVSKILSIVGKLSL